MGDPRLFAFDHHVLPPLAAAEVFLGQGSSPSTLGIHAPRSVSGARAHNSYCFLHVKFMHIVGACPKPSANSDQRPV